MHTKQIRVASVPPDNKMLCTMCARVLTGQYGVVAACCVIVCPMRLFFWFVILSTARLSVRSLARGMSV